MSEYGNNGRCGECDGNHGNHYSGCTYEGTGKSGDSYGPSGSSCNKIVFAIFLIIGALVTVAVPPIGVGIIILGAKITNV